MRLRGELQGGFGGKTMIHPRVQAAGYTLGVVDNATEQNLSTSEVQYVPGRKEVAWNLANL